MSVHDELSYPEQLIMSDFFHRLKDAERKHPTFAEGPYQGIGMVSAELGEATQCIVKGESEERIYDEMLDVLVTAFRFARGDWK